MQNFKVITAPNQTVKVEIEGVGTVRQVEIADKLFSAGVIDWKSRMKSTTIALTNSIIDIAINKLNLYPKHF
jgi:DNA-binding protein YbaB